MNGKATCAILKQIRRDIAEKNDIALTVAECHYQGDCSGTCPRCEAEVRFLEKALAEKRKRGIQTAVAGISAGLLAASLVSCTPVEAEKPENTGGAVEMTETETETERAEAADGEIAPPEATEGDGEEYELEGDVPAPDVFPEDEEEPVPTAGILPVPDIEQEETPQP